LIDTTLKKKSEITLKNAIPAAKSRDHHRYPDSTPLRQKGSIKRLPIAIAKSTVRTIYPTEAEELCQVLEMMIKRILAEEIQVHHAEELAIAA
jgi:hypothetical protein